ncbi:MAG: thiamine phosphate synthase [Pyrinomonadaceae bacterium]
MSFTVSKPLVYLITEGQATPANFTEKRREILDIIRTAVEAGVSLVQLREKKLPARLLCQLTVEAAAITRGSATRLLVNDRADIALAAKADGVHLTANSLWSAVIRASFPKEFIIGVSTHTVDKALGASVNGADFVVFGPVFEALNKGEPKGLAKLRKVCETLHPFPVLALGGIDESNVLSVLEAGATGFAAIRALNDFDSLRSICKLING